MEGFVVISRSLKGPASKKSLGNTNFFNSLSFGPIIQNMWRAEIILFSFNIFILPPSALCHSGSVFDGTRSFALATSRYIPSPPLPNPHRPVSSRQKACLWRWFSRGYRYKCMHLGYKLGKGQKRIQSSVQNPETQNLEGELEKDKHGVFFLKPLCRLLSLDVMYVRC